MKKLILQHWTGIIDELGELSSDNIKKYASNVGADYQLLRGDVFKEGKVPQIQKLHMLNECFDHYDVLVMMDMDMFTRRELEEDIFDEKHVGVGVHVERNDQLHKKMKSINSQLTNLKYPYWGGALYKLTLEMRQRLRAELPNITRNDFNWFNKNFTDEGLTHRLATLANIPKETAYLDKKWCFGSFWPGVKGANIIHVRTKFGSIGSKEAVEQGRQGYARRSKMENYNELVRRGAI